MVSAFWIVNIYLNKLFTASRKALRKRIAADGSKTITCQDLVSFMGSGPNIVNQIKAGVDVDQNTDNTTLCPIPSDVPNLPAIFQPRDGPLRALITSLTGDSSTTVSLTAPKARRNNTKVTSQGM